MFSSSSKEHKEETIKKRSFKNLPASTSLHSLDSPDEIRKESKPIVLNAESIETKSSDSEEETIDEEENSFESDTTEDDTDVKPTKLQSRKI
jgi:GTPase SAR1 family protein